MAKKKNDIYVQIASYRDPELIPTLLDLVKQSKTPKNLHVGICWQRDTDDETTDIFLDEGFDIVGHTEASFAGEFDKIDMEYKGAKFSVIDVPYIKAQGACWARNCIQQYYTGEKYTLQLDSHHRFVDEWDRESIEMLESLRSKKCKKPLLTGYIPSYDPENDPKGRTQEAWKMNFDRFIPEGAVFFLPSTIEGWKEMDKPIEARFYSAHFCFTDGIFCTEVQHDPEYFFHGEEISIAVRAFTHGYDMFHPHKIIAWHEYTRKNRTKIWDDHTHIEKKKGDIELDWLERNNACHARNRILFGMDGEDPTQIDFKEYGFGDKRTVHEYERFAGISFKYRGAQQNTLDNKQPIADYEELTEKEWKDSLALSNDIRICINKADLGEELLDDYDFFYVGAHNEHNEEIFRKDLTKSEIYNYFKNSEWIDYQFIFLSTESPKTYTIWPHSESKGWLDRIVRNVDTYRKPKPVVEPPILVKDSA